MNDVNAPAKTQPAFAQFLGIKITEVSPERVTGGLPARDELNNRHGIMHGGAIMALADNLGGTATTANLKAGQRTTTIESKTNFFAADPDRRYGLCRMHAAASRPHHHGLADPHHPRRRQALRAGDADANGARSGKIAAAISGRTPQPRASSCRLRDRHSRDRFRQGGRSA